MTRPISGLAAYLNYQIITIERHTRENKVPVCGLLRINIEA